MPDQERYISLQEAARRLGVERPALHYYIRALKLEKKKFELDKKTYIKVSDFERIKTLRDQAEERSKAENEVA